ncbi:tetratricopeptide repeat protein [Gammaproteobacteria bacterium]|nr:tetratricopeptide repeat protein [Gammaproteobacteria bacterium]
MTDDPLAPYAIDQPLTEEEQQLIEMLQTNEGGESVLEALDAAGAHLETSGGNGLRLAPWNGGPVVVEQLLQQALLPLSANLYQQGQAGLALGAAGLALRLGLVALGLNHADVLSSLNNLAACLRSVGTMGEVLPLYERTLAERERVLGSEHPHTLKSRNNLATCLESLGRAGEALPLLERTLTDQERILGPAHPEVFTSRNNLATCLRSLGRAGEALPLYERTLADRERVLDPDHPDTLTSRNNLATCLESLGRSDEALPLLERTLTDQERVLGPDHPDTLTGRSNLAVCLRSLGRAGEALPIYERSLVDRERVLGAEHPDTLMGRNNLATCLVFLGRDGEALPFYERVLPTCESILSSEHPDTILILNNLASCLESLGRASEALLLYERSLTTFERVLGPYHPDTHTSRNNLATCLESQGQDEEALLQWLALAQALPVRPHPGGRWLVLLGNCAAVLARHVQSGKLTDWDIHFHALSSSLLDVIDLESPEQMEAAQVGVAQFYATYLGLCVDLGRRELIPAVLAARQGRKLAALVLDELEAAVQSLNPDSLRGRFQKLRIELRQLALGLRVVEGSGGMPRAGGKRLVDATYVRQREQMETYKSKLEAYWSLKTELEQTDPDFAVSAAALNPRLSDLQARLNEDEGLVLLFERKGTDTEQTIQLALLISRVGSVLVPLQAIQLQQGSELAGAWRGQLHTRAGMRRAGGQDNETVSVATPEDDGLFGNLTSALRDGLWTPLAEYLDGINRLHLVSHGSLAPAASGIGCAPRFGICPLSGFHLLPSPASPRHRTGYHHRFRIRVAVRPGTEPHCAPWPGCTFRREHAGSRTHSICSCRGQSCLRPLAGSGSCRSRSQI